MIRERRTREKLQRYYRKYLDQGVLDSNVHPWVAEAWQKSRVAGVSSKCAGMLARLSDNAREDRLTLARPLIRQLDGLYENLRDFFSLNNISLMLLDHDSYVLKSYAMPYYQKKTDEVEGARLADKDIGASSIGIALTHKTPFFLYGPEIWLEECHESDAAAAPILRDGEVRYLLSMVMADGADKPGLSMDSLLALLISFKCSLEQTLRLEEMLTARHEILDNLPVAVYQVAPNGDVLYANRLGADRLFRGKQEKLLTGQLPALPETMLNYSHTQIPKAFLGIPSHNRELVWIIGSKTYEDLADVWPVYREGAIHSANVVSSPIEELKTMLAYASQYKARYSLSSLVGESPRFSAMKDKATRCARNLNHLLIVGEPGTGKQRLAHGIHQASPVAAGPLITIRCGDVSPELLPIELFGEAQTGGTDTLGKIELARGGTLFIDEIDKLSAELGEQLYAALKSKKNIRIIAAADVDPKRLVAKGIFADNLYVLISQSVLRTPSLRHRQTDIPQIATDILRELAEQNPMESKRLSQASMDLLTGYDWPGNVKQLQGVLEQGFFKSQTTVILPTDLTLPGGSGWGKAWKRDRNIFMEAWKACGGNISRLAANLGVSRVTLYRYLGKYGLERSRK